MSRRKTKPRRIGPLVPQVLAELGIEGAAAVIQIANHWEEAVGPEAAPHCRPSILRGSVLEATADSSVWCQQLQLERPRILAALRSRLGSDAPTDLRFRLT